MVVDFDALEAAGIANARGRAGLIDYLDKLGFTADEMVEAERRGRLFGLAGDVLQRSGPPDLQPARRPPMCSACRSTTSRTHGPLLGLTVAGPDHVALSQADVDGLATWVAMKSG